ncbi:MAG: DUF2330 domain-containing protein [Candidatus Sericytochromatia bacterium]|nr:DUF2330 domain-containing protein [Candidatus Sericytochromatia bacterium]
MLKFRGPLLSLFLLLAGSFAITPPPALACGGLFCQNIPVEQAGERIVFFADGKTVTAHVQIQYQGAAKDFSWIVPTPTQPTLKVGTERLFQGLRNTTRPVFQLDIESTKGTCDETVMLSAPVRANAPESMAKSGVVAEEKPVGPFDTAILQANDAEALKQWLRDNEYIVPQQVDPLLDPYVAGKYYFIALKLRKDRDAGDMQPITFTYEATKPGVPIRLTGVAATPDMGVFVWIFGNHRAVPDNFRHAAINEARIDWLNQGGNYQQVVTEAMNEAGGQAFVTDYAGSNSVLDKSAFSPEPLSALISELAGLSDPVPFTRKVLENSFQLQQAGSIGPGRPFPGPIGDNKAIAFLKRHVTKPSTLESVSDEEFFYNIERYQTELGAAQVSVNGKRVQAELEETVLEPARDIYQKLDSHPYLTRLYSTMSPEEMTQDPTFVFNPDAGSVSLMHIAKGVRLCSSDVPAFDAPVEITLENGLKFVARRPTGRAAPPTGGSDDPVLAMPAALRIEQYTTSGAANVITDRKEQVRTTLAGVTKNSNAVSTNSAGQSVTVGRSTAGSRTGSGNTSTPGFGCSGCSNPNRSSQNEGNEGLALGLFGVGVLGWRAWHRRRR